MDAPATLGEFLRRRKQAIVAEWERAARALPEARALDGPALQDHVPELLDRIAELFDRARAGLPPGDFTATAPDDHALTRLDHGYELTGVIEEYAALRRTILERIDREVPELVDARELALLGGALDAAIRAAADRFALARQRTLAALDHVATVALESDELEEHLPRLLAVLVETAEAVDLAVLFQREGEGLRARAAVGLEPADLPAVEHGADGGFLRRIVREGRPFLLEDASRAAAGEVPAAIVARGIRAFYGIPLVHGRDVLGVAAIGSFTAADFPSLDRTLFATMVQRATSFLVERAARAELEAALARVGEGESRLRLAIEATALGIWDWDLLQGTIRWTERARAIFGFSPDVAITPERIVAALHPADRARYIAARDRALDPRGDGRYEVEYRVQRPDGAERWVVARGQAHFEDGARGRLAARFIGTVLDVTERKTSETFLERSQVRTRVLAQVSALLLDSLDHRARLATLARVAVPALADSVGIYAVNERGEIEVVAAVHRDPGREALLHELHAKFPCSPDPRHPIGRVLASGETVVEPAFDRSVAELAASDEHRALLRALDARSAVAVPLRAHGKTLGVALFVYESSGRSYDPDDVATIEEVARRTAIAVDNALLYEAAQAAIRTRDAFVAAASHDLRNPLGTILMSTLLLEKRPADAEAVLKRARVIRTASERAARLVDDLLNVAAIESGKLRLELQSHPAADLVAEAVQAAVSPVATERRITVVARTESDPGSVLADRHQVLRVLENLIANAVKFSPVGGTVTVAAERAASGVRFSVADQGPGVPEGESAQLFVRGFQGAHGKPGLGLGLSIAKGLVDAHGGTIGVEPAPGGGARFFFTIPAA